MKISVPKGIRFVGHPGRRHLTKKMCVAAGETEPIWVVLSFSDLGLSNITGEGSLGTLQASKGPRPRLPAWVRSGARGSRCSEGLS